MKLIINGVETPETLTLGDVRKLVGVDGFKVDPVMLQMLCDEDDTLALTLDHKKEFIFPENLDKITQYNGRCEFGPLLVSFNVYEVTDKVIRVGFDVMDEDGSFGFGGA